MKFVATKEIRSLLRETIGARFSMEPIASGLLNQNVLVTTDAGAKFVFKAYRLVMPRAKVDETHRMMAHAAKRGISLPLPVATYEIGQHVAALYPFVDGSHPPRFGAGVRRVEAMGETLGRVDRVLDSFRPIAPKPSSLELASWDAEKFAAEIAAIRASLCGKPRRVRDDVEATLAMHEAILAKGDWDKRPFARLPVRVCHNDYHTQNVLERPVRQAHGGADGSIAVLDWEKAGWEWRGFEVARSVMFVCRRSSGTYCWDNVKAYLSGYKRHATLSDRERETAFLCGFNKAFFSLWAAREYVSGRTEMREHLLRRAKLMPYLFKNRTEFAQRIDKMLRSA